MCGIIGFTVADKTLSLKGKQFLTGVEMLKHRGPDSRGAVAIGEDSCFTDTIFPENSYNLGLGHTRLAILDLSSNGHQPMSDKKGNWIVYNGEVYNYIELKHELQQLGHCFYTETDTEIILASYHQWGTSCVERFNGMWAFVIYDTSRDILFCSRDRLGIKPFYFHHKADMFAFSSEIKPLFHLTNIKPVVLREYLAESLVNAISDSTEQTIYQGIRQLQGGHSAIYTLANHNWTCWRYWNLPADPDIDINDQEALDRFEELLEDSVRLRLRSDVPIAVTLSGGIDSSAIALACSRVQKEPITTFTSHFPDYPHIDETHYAIQVAQQCGLNYQLVEPNLSRLLDDEKKMCWHQELPYGSLSLYVHWSILKKIRESGIKVILSGQGGDELLLGYERYFVAKILTDLPNLPKATRTFWDCGRNSRLGLKGMFAYLLYFAPNQVQFLRRKWRLGQDFASVFLSIASSSTLKMSSNLRKLQSQELLGEQLAHLLRYDDRNSSAHGMETRLPFLDYRLVEFTYRLPWRFKIRDGWSKWLARKYLERHGLPTIAWRRQKLGFNAPIDNWANSLWEKYGSSLVNNNVTSQLLRKDLQTHTTQSPSNLWIVYNMLQLSAVMGWDDIV